MDGATVGAQQTITITDDDTTDDDTLAWSVSVAPLTIAEADTGSSTVTVSTGGVTFADAKTVTLDFTGSTAPETTDYTVGSKTLTLNVGSTSVTTTVTAVDDTVTDPNEQVKVAATVDGATVGAQQTITITDDDTTDDDTLAWSVSVAPLTIAEADTGSSTVTVSTGGVTFADAKTVTLDFTGSTATETTDYTVGSKTLTLNVGSTSVTTTVTAVDDTVTDPNEQVKVAATVDGATVGAQQTITITDDDAPGWRVSVEPSTIAEADTGSSTVTVSTGGVTFAAAKTVTLDFTGSTATETTDYTVGSKTLTLNVGSTSVTTTVTAVDDTVTDPNEQVKVAATVDGATVGAQQTITITDDDAPGWRVSVEPSTIAEADTGSSTVTVSTGGVTFAAAKTVTLDFTGSTATETTDYTVRSKTLTLGAGSSSVTTTVTAVDDTAVDPNEQVKVAATVDGSTVGVQQTITITDDDAPVWSVSVDPSTITEADTGSSTVTVSTGGVTFADAKTVTLDFTDSTATETTDYTVGSKTLTLGAGSSSVTTTVTAVDDTAVDPNEQVKVAATVDGATVGAQQTVTITDDDAPGWRVSVDPSTIAEADAGSSTVTVSTGGVTFAAAKTVTLDFTGSTATETTDYTVGSKTLTLGVGSTSVTTTVTAVDDTAVDPNEQVKVAATVDGATVGAQQTVTITDDDAPVWSVSVDPSTIAEADTGSSTVTVSTGGVTFAAAKTVTLDFTGSTATETTDYTVVSKTLTIGAGSTSVTTTVTAVDDTAADPNEQVKIAAMVDGSTVGAQQTITITDDDASAWSVSVAPSTIAEADTGSSTVTVSTGGMTFTAAKTVTLDFTGSTATETTDYTVGSKTLTLGVGSTSVTTTVTAVDDTAVDPNEQVKVAATVDGATVGAQQTVTITDDDAPPAQQRVRLSMEGDSEWVMEGAGPTDVTVKAELTGETRDEQTRVDVQLHPHEASANDFDAETESFPILIPANQKSATHTFRFTPTDDAEEERDENVMFTGDTGNLDIPVDPTTLMIKDNDDAPAAQQRVKLSMDGDSEWVMEGAGPTEVTVKAELTGGMRGEQTRVDVQLHPHEASANDFDAETESFPILIPANQKSATHTFRFTPTDDAEEERDENLMFTGDTGNLDIPVDPTTLMIKDNDGSSSGITLSVRPREVVEDAGPARIRVTARLDDGPRPSATTVQVTVDEDEDNYGLTPAMFDVEIPEGTTSAMGTFVLRPVADTKDERDQRVAITGTTSTEGLAVSVTELTIKDDDEANRPPTFGTQRYAFNLQEQQDGREQPIVLGAVSARDPDGEQVRYSLVAGDAARFTVASGSGDVAYVGPGEDFETGPTQYELTVQARDDHDGKRPSAQVVVTVTDVPEAPVAAADAAETAEDEPVVVDVLANDTDPDGDSLRIVAVTAPAHGTATLSEGGVRYEPSSNYHGSDAFRYTVADPGGLAATATVTLTVTPVNDPPDAVDDEAETLEDELVVVDVLANDTDVDGDLLRIVSATAPAHGTATVGAGGVRYAPVLNYHGQDSFDYTIADPGGLTDTATVTVTVLPVNDAPEAVGVIPDQPLEEGGEPVTLDIARYFTDVDGDVLTYTAESSNPAATAVTVSGSTLTLSAVVRGAATVTVTATDPDGLTATQVFGVSVGDRLVREVLTDTLAALGRGHLSSVRQTVGRRLESGGADARRLTVAGQSFGPEAWDRVGSGSLAQTHDLLFRAATLQQRAAATDMVGTSADPRLRQPGGFTSFGGFSGDWDRALPATDVLMAFGGGDASAEEPTGGGPRWTVWGQGDLQTFRGTPEPVKGYEGDLRTGYLGVDAQVTRRWLLGVAMARSGGSGTWQRGASAGELSTTLTRVHPYVRWADGDTAVWGVLGAGRGTATHVRTLTGLGESSPLSLGLGLLEGRRRVATVGRGFEIGVRGEASWARLETGGGDETIDDLEAGVRRLRGGVEVTRALSGPGGLTLTPFGAVSTRHDGGAGQTGVGLEVAGGLRLHAGRVQLEAQGRRLVLHSATAYEEQGVSLAATVGSSPYEPGLTLSLRPTWGAAGMGAETLWQDQIQSYMQGSAYDQTGMDARLGYGLRLGQDGLLTPFTSFGQRQHSGQRLQVGTVVGTLGQGSGSLHGPFQIEVSGERYDRPGGNADHRFSMFGVLNLGGSAPAYDITTGIDPRLHDPASDLLDVAALQDADPPAPATDVAPVDETATPALVNAAAVGEAMPAVVLAPAAVADTPAGGAAPMPAALSATAYAESVPAEADRFLPDAVVEATGTRKSAVESSPAVRMTVRREEVDLQGALRSTVAAREPASEFLAPVKETRAARTGRSSSRPNRPPVFSAPSYAFETPSRRGSRGDVASLGFVLARDPDRGPVTYSLTAGDWTRFEVDAASGAITYLGPDLPGTRRYKLQVTARDTGRLTETVTVAVTVASAPSVPRTGTTGAADAAPSAAPVREAAAPRNAAARAAAGALHVAGVRAAAGEPRTAAALPASVVRSIAAARAGATPRAVSARRPASAAPRGATARAVGAGRRTALADAARTYAGVPVLIDVLENDAEREGIRIVDVTTPAHGTVTVTNGVVRYAPAPGHRGRDTFTYTVVGKGGWTARASVTVLVVG